jgi:hypothetical protein
MYKYTTCCPTSIEIERFFKRAWRKFKKTKNYNGLCPQPGFSGYYKRQQKAHPWMA